MVNLVNKARNCAVSENCLKYSQAQTDTCLLLKKILNDYPSNSFLNCYKNLDVQFDILLMSIIFFTCLVYLEVLPAVMSVIEVMINVLLEDS